MGCFLLEMHPIGRPPHHSPCPSFSHNDSPRDKNSRNALRAAHAPSPSPSLPTYFSHTPSTVSPSLTVLRLCNSSNSSTVVRRPFVSPVFASFFAPKQSTACGH